MSEGQDGVAETSRDKYWGATPSLRAMWSSKDLVEVGIWQTVTDSEVTRDQTAPHSYSYEAINIDGYESGLAEEEDEDEPLRTSIPGSPVKYPWAGGQPPSYPGSPLKTPRSPRKEVQREPPAKHFLYQVPSIILVVLLNLFLSISFGSAFFPASWEFPEEVPRTIGVQLFLFSTTIGQIVLNHKSQFTAPVGMMMAENISFMLTICNIVNEHQGHGVEAFSTVLVTFSLSSIVVGLAFYLFGRLKLGSLINCFPRAVIVGCIGGIGVFIFKTGMEVSTNRQFTPSTAAVFFDMDIDNGGVLPLWGSALLLELLLRAIMRKFDVPLLPPFYFILIPPAFYALLFLMGVPLDVAHGYSWFFPSSHPPGPTLMWSLLLRVDNVDWVAAAHCIPTVVALTIFAFMHVPVNIPSLKFSTGEEVDINQELVAHGYSNLLSGGLGGLPNYLCYSNSVLYYKCHGGGKRSGYLVAAVTAIFFFIGPCMVYHVPRLMPGCLLLHVGTYSVILLFFLLFLFFMSVSLLSICCCLLALSDTK
jgi:SulP family sulfate permease